MSKHTPGPWEIEGEFNISGPRRDIGRIANVCTCGGVQSNKTSTRDESAANARLIAAAPALLEAAKRMIRDQDKPTFSTDFHGAVDALRAAIALTEPKP